MILNSNFKFQISNYRRGFTLIELAVVIAVIAFLSGIILFTVTQYISKGKDSNISANLAVLIPAGEVFYNINGNSYAGFCDPTQSSGSVLMNALSQMPDQSSGAPCYNTLITPTANPKGVCCYAQSQAWAACAKEFTTPTMAYCVDSRGMKEEMCNSTCASSLTQCPDPITQTNCH